MKYIFATLMMISMSSAFAQEGPGPHGPHQIPPEVKAAMDACIKDTGIVMTPGQRPTDGDRKILQACMEEKGFRRPPHPPKDQ